MEAPPVEGASGARCRSPAARYGTVATGDAFGEEERMDPIPDTGAYGKHSDELGFTAKKSPN